MERSHFPNDNEHPDGKPRSGRKPYLGKNFNPKFRPKDRQSRPLPKYPGETPQFVLNGPPKALPPSKKPIVTRDEPMWKDSVFGPDPSLFQEEEGISVNLNLATVIPLAEQTIDSIYRKDQHLEKILTREAFRYYVTGLTWMKIIESKRNSAQETTPEERLFREFYFCKTYMIPEPIGLFLKTFGHVETMTGERVDPHFPSLPCANFSGYGGFYDENPYNIENHNLYEEIPTLGVAAEACRQCASDAPSGHYVPSLTPHPGLRANQNLLGYAPLTNRRSEAKNMLFANGITADDFPENIPNTAINIKLLDAVSEALRGVTAFTMFELNIANLSQEGSRAMLFQSSPVAEWNPQGTPYTDGTFKTSTLVKDTPVTVAISEAFLFQLRKEPRQYGSQPNNCWLGFNYTDENPVPQGMVDNRNERRSRLDNEHGLDTHYQKKVFSATSISSRSRRTFFINSLLKS